MIVKFNAKAYANTENILEYLEEQFIPILRGQPSLLVLDLFAAHKTLEVLDTFLANNITISHNLILLRNPRTWAVGEAWETFSRERVEVVKKSSGRLERLVGRGI